LSDLVAPIAPVIVKAPEALIVPCAALALVLSIVPVNVLPSAHRYRLPSPVKLTVAVVFCVKVAAPEAAMETVPDVVLRVELKVAPPDKVTSFA
jgi:hypothetical protein